MTKTPLTVIDAASKPDPLAPPASLGEAGRRLWADVHRDYEVIDAVGLEMLARICAMADRAAEYAAAIERDGVVIRSKNGMVRDHPANKHLLACQSFILRSLQRLNFDVIPPRTELGRPSGGGDYRGVNR
ncbi:hypothetical protein AB7M49_006088 [Bradyrhizobium elkanii]